jgi:hypothetical protein
MKKARITEENVFDDVSLTADVKDSWADIVNKWKRGDLSNKAFYAKRPDPKKKHVGTMIFIKAYKAK